MTAASFSNTGGLQNIMQMYHILSAGDKKVFCSQTPLGPGSQTKYVRERCEICYRGKNKYWKEKQLNMFEK